MPCSALPATARMNNAGFESFPDMSHTMMLEPDWQRVADKFVAWIEGRF
ncbi:MAG: hypothetical protein AB9Q22_00200 [Candidatus Reddybacter sp.]